jgi:DNA-binding CsgD family transcriptional regulator
VSSTRALVEVIKQAYDCEDDENEWLTQLCRRLRPLLDEGFGILAYTWQLRGTQPVVTSVARAGGSDAFERYPQQLLRMVGDRARPLLCTGSSTLSTRGWFGATGVADDACRRLLPVGVVDVAMVMARAGSAGLVVSVPLTRQARSRPRQRAWSLVAGHWAFALELRAALRRTASPALMRGLGPEPRPLRRATTEQAREVLRGLSDGEWLATRVVRDDSGELLLAAKRDPHASPHPLSALERQVARAAALGHSHKQIAYDLGMAPNRVAHHLRGIMLKLAVSTRAELQRRWTLETMTTRKC